MTNIAQTTAEKEKLGIAQPLDAPLEIAPEKQKKPRTRGLWLFDAVLYNITNLAVFAISVVFTYLTQHGATRRASDGTILKKYDIEKSADGKTDSHYITKDEKTGEITGTYKAEDTKLVFRGFGKWMNSRGDWLIGVFKSWGMSHDTADMGKMVFFSFADGTLVAPLVKLAEDRREKIAYWLDKKMGTVPEDLSVYDAEPKQSWGSVITGRLATVSVVVPVAVMLEGIGTKNGKWNGEWTLKLNKKVDTDGRNLNDKLFNDPGETLGKKIAEDPERVKKYDKRAIDVPYLYKTFAFEAFYTTVCTVGLYYASRFIATITGKKNGPEKSDAPDSSQSKLPTVHSVKLSRESAEKVEATLEKKFSTEKLKTNAPTPAAEQFSERPKHSIESVSMVTA